MTLRFGTDGVRGHADELTDDLVTALGRAAGRVLAPELRTSGDRFVIGRDPRLSGPRIEAALVAGLSAEGVAVEQIEKRDQLLNKRQSTLDRQENELETLHRQTVEELQRVSGMTRDEAKTLLLAEVERESRADMVRVIRQIEEEAQSEGERRARELIADAIQRVASDHVAEITVSVVPLPSDEMKGRIIGRNGRNIRAFEQAAGVDVVVDDTPEAVTISSFDSVRREIARRTGGDGEGMRIALEGDPVFQRAAAILGRAGRASDVFAAVPAGPAPEAVR